MYYIFHGEDDFSQAEELRKMQDKMGDPQFAELNTVRLDGRKVTLGELRHACDAMPFLADKRMIVVDGLLTHLESRRKRAGEPTADEDKAGTGGDAKDEEADEAADPAFAKGLVEYLPLLPETARLFFVEHKTLGKNNPVLKQAEVDRKSKRAFVREFKPPRDDELGHWIESRVAAEGGLMEPQAVHELVANVGPDLRLLDNEIRKLLVYRNGEPITAGDVLALVTSVRESTVFALVDAIGRQERRSALQLLHEQLDQGEAPLYLLSMIERQFRLILQVKDLSSRNLGRNEMRERLKLHPFVMEKVSGQAFKFSIPQLLEIFQRLLETDVAIKTGRSEPVVAVDLLVSELTQP